MRTKDELDTPEANRMELMEIVECCNGPSLESCCFDCDAHSECNNDEKCGGLNQENNKFKFYGGCVSFNDTKCPLHPDHIFPYTK